jgi:hypothetical protein
LHLIYFDCYSLLNELLQPPPLQQGPNQIKKKISPEAHLLPVALPKKQGPLFVFLSFACA